MDYSLLVGIHDTEQVDSSEPEDEQDGEDGVEQEGGTTGDESGDGLEEPPSPHETSIDGNGGRRHQRFSRTESVSSSDGYDSEHFAMPCSDGKMFRCSAALRNDRTI